MSAANTMSIKVEYDTETAASSLIESIATALAEAYKPEVLRRALEKSQEQAS